LGKFWWGVFGKNNVFDKCLPRKLLKREIIFAFEHFISTKTAETRFLNGVSADYRVAGCDYELIRNT
jgi:hypothetical protein